MEMQIIGDEVFYQGYRVAALRNEGVPGMLMEDVREHILRDLYTESSDE